MKTDKDAKRPTEIPTVVTSPDGRYSWTRFESNDRECVELLFDRVLNGITECVPGVKAAVINATLEIAAQQWDRLGRYMRMNAAKSASNPEVAQVLQRIGIGATDRANHLRSQIDSTPAVPTQETK